MAYTEKSEDAALFARLDDLMSRADRGEVTCTAFLTPREVRVGQRYVTAHGYGQRMVVWGGYEDAERARLFFLPEYCEGLVEQEAWSEQMHDAVEQTVVAIRIRGSGYRTLSHRDFMGSVLGLGIDRAAVGDIVALDDREAVVFCGEPVATFLVESLEKVASDTVKVSRVADGKAVSVPRRFAPVSDTVASPRLDCVVAALANLSRERAQEAIRSGLCEVDYESVEACDALLTPPCVLSIRGAGKFRLMALSGPTKKGRLRLTAEKYI